MPKSDRDRLRKTIKKGQLESNQLKRSQALLLLVEGWAPMEIPSVVGCGEATVRRVRQRYERGGLDAVFTDKKAPGAERQFSIQDEQRIVAMVCSDPPSGRARWTVRLIAQEATRRSIVPRIGKDKILMILQEHDLKPWREKNVVRSSN